MIRLKHCFVVLLLTAVCSVVQAQTKVRVSGTVSSADDGLPLIGAGVMDSQGNGVITDLDGKYEIMVEPGTELLFSCIGFEDEKHLIPNAESLELNVAMQTESLKLEDAVVIAYGVRKK